MAEDSVGRVAVEVVPDASEFRKKAQAELEKQKVDPKNVDLVPVIDANMAELQARMEKIAQSLDKNAQIKVETDLSALQAIEPYLQDILPKRQLIEVDWDPNSEKALRDALARIEKTFATRHVLNVDNSNFEEIATEIKARLAEIESEKVRISAEIALDEAKLKAEEERLTQNDIKVPVKPDLSEKDKAETNALLAWLTRKRNVDIGIDVGKGSLGIASVLSGFHALEESVSEAHKGIIEMFKDLPQFATMTTAVFALAGGFLSAASNVASLAGSAAQALPVLLALPGIAIGMFVLTTAFGNLAKTMPDVAAELKAFKASIQQDFWSAPVAGVGTVKDAFRGFLDTLTGSFGGLATTMGTFMGTLFASLKDVPLASFFDNLSASVGVLQGYMGGLTNTFSVIGSVGSAMLVPLAALFGDLVTRFGTWIEQLVTNAGGVKAFADQSVGALSAIIETVIQLGRIFGAVFRAATDSGSLTFTTLADKMKNWADGGGLDKLQATLTTVFTSAQTMWDNFAKAAGGSMAGAFDNIVKLLSAVLPVVGTITGTLTKLLANAITPEAVAGIQAFVDGIGKGVQAMAPAFATLGPLIGQLGPVLGSLATTIGTVFGALTPTIENLVPGITQIITILGGGLADVLTALSPMITQLGTILKDALASPAFKSALQSIVSIVMSLVPVLQPIIDLVGQLIPLLMPMVAAILQPIAQLIGMITPLLPPITDVISTIVAALVPIIPALVQLVMAVLTPLLPIIVQLVTALAPLLAMTSQLIGAILPPLLTILTNIITFAMQPLTLWLGVLTDAITVVAGVIMTVFKAALEWIQGMLATLSAGIGAFSDWWQGIWTSVSSFFQGIWNDMLNWLKDLLGIHSPSTWFLDLATNMLAGMLNGLTAGWTYIVSFFTAAWTWLKTTVSGAFEAVKTTVLNAWSAVSGYFTTAWDNLQGIVSGGWSKVKGFFTDGATSLKTTVSDAWAKVTGFFSSGITNAIKLVTDMPGKLVSGLGGLTKVLYQKGRDIVQGLLNGVGSLAGKIGDWFLDKIPGWIREPFKSALGIHSPSKVFHGFGENIIDGLINGMEDNHAKVFRSMDSLASGMADTKFALPTVNGGGLASVAAQVAAAMGGTASRVLNYYAAPGSGLSSEEELFAAAGRGRMVW